MTLILIPFLLILMVDYAMLKAGRTPDPTTRLPSSIWKTLSRPGMKDPNSTKPISRRAYKHSVVQEHIPATDDPHPGKEAAKRDAFHASLGLYKAASQSNTRPVKSSVSPAHPSRFLADNPEVLYKKDGNTYIPVGCSSMSANFHKWYTPEDNSPPPSAPLIYVYHSNNTDVSKPGYAMVDRGANGCIIGSYACLISKDIWPRYVNVTGINNHQIQNIPIATCGAPDGNIYKRYQSPQPTMNVHPFNDDVLSGVVYSDIPAVNGDSKIAQIFFGQKSHIIHVEEMRTTADSLSCFQNFV
eukprot:jgi/Psemu1/3625/gm1.3625_g